MPSRVSVVPAAGDAAQDLDGWVGVGLGLASALALVAMQMAVDLA